jgi:DNA-3-methyladenine glycosylase
MKSKRLNKSFFKRDVLEIAPDLLGKFLVRKFPDGSLIKYKIVETEAYRGEEDEACHACKGRTPRTDVMYREGGKVYVYLIYGMYWMLNFVTGNKEHPQAILIRGVEGFIGPGKVGRLLKLDKSFYAEDLSISKRIWVEDSNEKVSYKTDKRIGIDYAGSKWRNMKWRYILNI